MRYCRPAELWTVCGDVRSARRGLAPWGVYCKLGSGEQQPGDKPGQGVQRIPVAERDRESTEQMQLWLVRSRGRKGAGEARACVAQSRLALWRN